MSNIFKTRRITNPDQVPDGVNKNDFAFLHSSCYAQIAGKKKYEQKSKDCDLYVSVSYKKKKIYLNYHSAAIGKDTVLLSYSNLARLGLRGSDEVPVEIKKSCSFCYSWCNGNSAARLGFRLTVISGCVGILSLIIGVIALVR